MASARIRVKLNKTFDVDVSYASSENELWAALVDQGKLKEEIGKIGLENAVIETVSYDKYEPLEDDSDE